jgi:hypothetical protein
MKIQINNAEILDLTISELYDCWLVDKESFHHWLTRKSNIKIPPEADTGTWFFSDKISGERVFAVDLKEYIEWWNPLVAYIRHVPVDSYKIIEESIANIEFNIYNNDYPDGYWE